MKIFLIFIILFTNILIIPDIFAQTTTHIQYIDDKTSQIRSHLIETIHKDPKNSEQILITKEGKGNFDQFTNVTWKIESTMYFKETHLLPLRTICTIKDKKLNIVRMWKNEFNYDKQQIIVTFYENNNKKPKEYIFPIKGYTADIATLNLFLQSYVPNLSKDDYKSFYLLTADPKLFKVNIKHVKEEFINTPSQKNRAIKLRLIADMGILDEVFDKFVPPTFIWYETTSPHQWLKYQGFETSESSAYIRAEIKK